MEYIKSDKRAEKAWEVYYSSCSTPICFRSTTCKIGDDVTLSHTLEVLEKTLRPEGIIDWIYFPIITTLLHSKFP